MSMPSFPKNGANMTRDEALTMIIASIAMEEKALGRVIDAEGDKLRYILDRCREACGNPEIPKDILAVNNSVTSLLEAVAQNQTILRNKLALALDACGKCPPKPPCPPPCPEPCPTPCPPKPPKPPCPEPAQNSFLQLGLSGNDFLWKGECLIPWESLGGRGSAVRWSGKDPAQVELDPGRAYSVSAIFNIREFQPTASSGRICLERTGAARNPLPLCFFTRRGCGDPITLQYSALLLPDRRPPSNGASAISFRLRSRVPLYVEQAELNIIEV